MANAMLNIQIIPRTATADDVYPAVDRAIEIVKQSGVAYEVGALGTTMEGDLDQLLQIARDMNVAMIENGSPSVISQIRLFLTATDITMDSLTEKHRH